MSRAASVPLARLMTIAAKSLVDGLHVRLVERGFTGVRPSYGYVMLAARAAPTSVTAIAALMGATKQAASKLVDQMTSDGLLARKDHKVDARKQVLVLTAKGRRLLDAVEGIYAELEAEWADVLGKARVESLRADLVRVLEATHGGVLPPVRPMT